MLNEHIATALEIRIHDNLHIFAVVILFYDYLVTIGDEVEYMWMRPKARSTWLFFMNRYFSLLSNIAVTILGFTSLPDKTCRRYNIARQVLLIINQAIICLLFSLRIYALYGRSFRLSVFLLCTAAVLGAVALAQLFGQKSDPSKIFAGCHIGFSHQTAFRLSGAWGTLFLYDFILFGLTLFKTWQTRRGHGDIPIVKLIFRDGAIYFAVVTFANAANIITYWICGPFMKGGLSTFSACISSVMMSRLMLNLHAATDLGLYSTYIPRAAPDEMTDSSSSQPCRTVELDTLWTADLERSHPGPGPGPRISDPDSRILHDLGVPHPPPSPAPPRTAS